MPLLPLPPRGAHVAPWLVCAALTAAGLQLPCAAQTELAPPIEGTSGQRENFGAAIDLSDDGRRLVVLAEGFGSDDEEEAVPGRLVSYELRGGSWQPEAGELTLLTGNLGVAAPRLAVSADGRLAAVGYWLDGDDDLSEVRIVRLGTNGWEPDAPNLIAPEGERFTGYVALDGDGNTLAVRGEDAIFIYARGAGGEWPTLPSSTIPFNAASGFALSRDGSRLVVAVIPPSGFVQLYERNGDSFAEVGEPGITQGLVGGTELAISGDGLRIAMGELTAGNDDNPVGRVRAYAFADGAWSPLGEPIVGDVPGFGFAVALSADGSRLLVGGRDGPGDASDFEPSRSRVFDLVDGAWVQVGGDLLGSFLDLSGYDVALSADGSVGALGAPTYGLDRGLPGRVTTWDLTGLAVPTRRRPSVGLVAYPNPTHERISVRGLPARLEHVALTDAAGRPVAGASSSTLTHSLLTGGFIDVVDLPDGTYLLHLEGGGLRHHATFLVARP